MDKKIKVSIIGATGYAGIELLRILYAHNNVEVVALSSVSFEGKKISEIYPNLADIYDDVLVSSAVAIDMADVVFASLPHGLCEDLANECITKGKLFIDLGADFRLTDENDYKEYYELEYKFKDLHKISVYSIPELHRDNINKDTKIIANPGCYPTSIALGLAPILKTDYIDTKTIIIDSKSGATGAGRGLSLSTHYPELNDNFAPYKIATHRHTPEIEQTLSNIKNEKINVTFVPHLLPINRGIVSTIYINLTKDISLDEIHALYIKEYKNEKFVRVMNKSSIAELKYVVYSNYCNISLHKDERTNRLIIISVLDNMVKGAAGQAIQNMNILCNLKEDTGLNLIPTSL